MRQSACLVFNPITVNNFASLFNCTTVGRASLDDGPDIKLFILVGLGRSFFVCGSVLLLVLAVRIYTLVQLLR